MNRTHRGHKSNYTDNLWGKQQVKQVKGGGDGKEKGT